MGSAPPPTCSLLKTLLKMPGTGLKTAPFQCQGKKGGVNEGLGEGAYGRAGERG